jgi:opacity protein-like surface antigen
MNHYLKKIAIIAIVVAMSAAAHAQVKGDKDVGVNLVFTPLQGPFEFLGIGAKFRYNITNPFRLESLFYYLFEKNNSSSWDFFVTGHLLIPIIDRIRIYPLLGFGIIGNSRSDTMIGCSYGCGIDYKISDKLFFNAEYVHKMEAALGDPWNIQYFTTGVVYRF